MRAGKLPEVREREGDCIYPTDKFAKYSHSGNGVAIKVVTCYALRLAELNNLISRPLISHLPRVNFALAAIYDRHL